MNFMNYLKTEWVYKANSLVGQINKALAPTILEWDCNLFIIGIKKDAVLPDPVLEHATTSLPSNIWGIAFLFFIKIKFILFLFYLNFKNYNLLV